MTPLKRRICHVILYLDRIPRYGRYYVWLGAENGFSAVKWKYQKRGYWGLNFLDKIGWFGPYLDEQLLKAEMNALKNTEELIEDEEKPDVVEKEEP